MKKLIVFTHGGGRLANQLTNFGHLLAFIEEYKTEFELLNLAFRPYAELFNVTAKHPKCYYPEEIERAKWLDFYKGKSNNFITSRLLQIIHLVAHLKTGWQSIKSKQERYDIRKWIAGQHISNFNFDDIKYLNELRKYPVTVLAGWPIRSWELFEKHKETIRGYFRVHNSFYKIAKPFIDSLRAKHGLIIGVLIRQTDYRIWNNGRYYFDTQQFAKWIEQAQKVFADKNPCFVVTSDEKQDKSLFNGLNVYYATGTEFGTGHYMENFSELSFCDIIMTPPSTFSVWAAFLGNASILPLCRNNQEIKEEDILKRNIFDAIKHPDMKQSVK